MPEKTHTSDGLLTGSIIFGVGMLLINGMSYLYQILMARMLGPEGYGTFGGLFALVLLVILGAETYVAVISRFTSTYQAQGEPGMVHTLISSTFRRTLLYGLLPLAIGILLSPQIAQFFKLDSRTPVLVVTGIAYLGLINPIFAGGLNGLQRFKSQNFVKVVGATMKLGFGVLFVALGWGISGALMGMAISGFAVLILSTIALRDIMQIPGKPISERSIYTFFMPALVATLSLNAMVFVDVILVKHFCEDQDAGFYAALGNFGKIMWYGSCFGVGAMFPKISKRHAQNKDTRPILIKSIGLMSLCVVTGLLAYRLFPTGLVKVVFGEAYLPMTDYLFLTGGCYALYSFNFLMNQYNLAVHRTSHIWVLASAALIEIVAIILKHDSLWDVLGILFSVNLLTAVVLVFMSWRDFLPTSSACR